MAFYMSAFSSEDKTTNLLLNLNKWTIYTFLRGAFAHSKTPTTSWLPCNPIHLIYTSLVLSPGSPLTHGLTLLSSTLRRGEMNGRHFVKVDLHVDERVGRVSLNPYFLCDLLSLLLSSCTLPLGLSLTERLGRWGCHSYSPGWKEPCCSRDCWSPRLENCWNCLHHQCRWPHQTVCSLAAWSDAHLRRQTPLPLKWAHPQPSRPTEENMNI